MQNTANDIEALGDAKGYDLTVDGSDLNALEDLAAAAEVELTYHGNDDNVVEFLDAEIPDET